MLLLVGNTLAVGRWSRKFQANDSEAHDSLVGKNTKVENISRSFQIHKVTVFMDAVLLRLTLTGDGYAKVVSEIIKYPYEGGSANT